MNIFQLMNINRQYENLLCLELPLFATYEEILHRRGGIRKSSIRIVHRTRCTNDNKLQSTEMTNEHQTHAIRSIRNRSERTRKYCPP